MASALVLCDEVGRTAVVMTFDALFVGEWLDATLSDWLRQEYNVRRNDILFLASHTHFAPALDPSKPLIGPAAHEHVEWVIGQCKRLLAGLLDGAFTKLTARKGTSEWDGAIYRRRPWPLPYLIGRQAPVWGEPAMAPNPRGPVDTRISVWELSAAGGERMAVIWSCACHPAGYPSPSRVSSDYCGVVRERLRSTVGAEVTVLFMQGFCGDLRPRVTERRSLRSGILHIPVFGPTFPNFGSRGWSAWSARLSAAVAQAWSNAGPTAAEPITGEVKSSRVAISLSEIIKGNNGPARWVTFQRLKAGNLIDIVAVSAEPSTLLRKMVPFEGSTPVGYLGDVFGYWPTERQRREGGYEGGRFFSAFGLHGRFRPGLDDIFRAAVGGLSVLS